MNRNDRIEKIAALMARARESKNVSQIEMAKRIGKHRSTVQNWEAGYSAPDLPQFLEWYEALGINPGTDIYTILYPDTTECESDEDRVNREFVNLVGTLTLNEKKAISFLLRSAHGSDRYAVLQEIVANLQCPMNARQSICNMIIHNYEDAEEMGALTEEKDLQPDMEALKEAYRKGRNAARQGQNTYHIS